MIEDEPGACDAHRDNLPASTVETPRDRRAGYRYRAGRHHGVNPTWLSAINAGRNAWNNHASFPGHHLGVE